MINNNYYKSQLIQGNNIEGLKYILSILRGKVDLIYIDPPFNTNQVFYYDSNKIGTVSSKTKTQIAYEDKFNLESYLAFIKERLLLLKELLSDEGSIYVHIDTKMSHYLKILMDDVFGIENFKNDITRIKCNPKNFNRAAYGNEKDVILFYAKNGKRNIWNEIKINLNQDELKKAFKKRDKNGNFYTTVPVHAPSETKKGASGTIWRNMFPPIGRHWRYNPNILDKLDAQGKIEWSKNGVPRIIKYANEHRGKKIQDIWRFKDPQNPKYPTEKNINMIEMIIKQSSREQSYVLDCFSGSGTTLLAAENTNRKWIGIDNSSIAIKVSMEKLKESEYDFIQL